MLFNYENETDKSGDSIVNDATVRKTILFDFESKTFPIIDGSPIVVEGLDSAAEFVKNLIHVEQGKKAVYDDDYGASKSQIIGKRIKDGFELSQFYNRIASSVRKCEAIDSVDGFKFEKGIISFRVKLKSGESALQMIDVGGEV